MATTTTATNATTSTNDEHVTQKSRLFDRVVLPVPFLRVNNKQDGNDDLPPSTNNHQATKPSNEATAATATTFFPLNLVGLSSPPLVLPMIPILLCYYRTIPFWDRFFSIAFPLYLSLANRFRFNNNARQVDLRKQRGQPSNPEIPEWMADGVARESWFPKYMITAATMGVILPLLLQLVAPTPIAEAAAPHLFVLLCQILMETMANGGPNFHPLLQLINPIGFSAYRMGCLKTWIVVAWQLKVATSGTALTVVTWENAHLILAVLNGIFWTYNTFVTLLLRILPRCLDERNFPDAADVSWKYQLIPSVNAKSDGKSEKTKTI